MKRVKSADGSKANRIVYFVMTRTQPSITIKESLAARYVLLFVKPGATRCDECRLIEQRFSHDGLWERIYRIFFRMSQTSRELCRSPVYTRRPQQQRLKIMSTKSDTEPLPLQPTTLLSLDTNEKILSSDHEMKDSVSSDYPMANSPTTQANSSKRVLEPAASEQILIKRRYQKLIPSNALSLR